VAAALTMTPIETNPVAVSIAAVLPREGDLPIGTAFLVHESGLVVTCAHVLEQAGISPGGVVRLSMRGQIVKAHVINSYWRRSEDIAFASLTSMPPDARPVQLGGSASSRHHRFVTYGFPVGKRGISGYGSIGDRRIDPEQIQLYHSSEVTSGFSGAPLFDEQTRRVIGMIVAITVPIDGRLSTTSFAIPSESLWDIACELKPSRDCPYRDLMYFTEADSHLWHGREQLVAQARKLLKKRPPCIAVFGPSGSGKSSFLRAGMVPLFRELARERGEAWTVVVSRPADRPFESNQELRDAIASDATLVLVIDQLEDIFVGFTDEQRAELLRQILVHAQRPKTWLVFGMRDDFYGQLARAMPQLLELMLPALLQLPMELTLQCLQDIVRKPAETVGLSFDPPDLYETIARAAVQCRPGQPAQRGHQPDTALVTVLPLLEVALTRIWNLTEDSVMRAPGFTAEKLTEALTERAHVAYRGFTSEQRQIADLMLFALIDPVRSGTLGKGARVSLEQLRRETTNVVTLTSVVEIFISARIIVALREPGTEQEVIELIHDTLITDWSDYQKLRKRFEELITLRDDVEQAADRWDRAGRHLRSEYLLSEHELEKMEGWRAQAKIVSLKPNVHELMRASVTARRIRWAVYAAIVAVLVAASVGAGIQARRAGLERDQAQAQTLRAEGLRLVTEAQVQRDPTRALALLRVAARPGMAPDVQAAACAAGLLTRPPVIESPWIFPGNPVYEVRFSADSAWIFAREDQRVQLMPVVDDKDGGWTYANYSDVGKRIVLGGSFAMILPPLGETVRVSDADSDAEIASFPESAVRPQYLASSSKSLVSPDRTRRLELTADEKNLRLMDQQRDKLLTAIPLSSGVSAAFSPDSKLFALGSAGSNNGVRDAQFGNPCSSGVDGTTVAFSPDGALFLAIWGATATLWKTTDFHCDNNKSSFNRPNPIAVFAHPSNISIHAFAFSPDSSKLVTWAYDERLRIWDTHITARLRALRAPIPVRKGLPGVLCRSADSRDPPRWFPGNTLDVQVKALGALTNLRVCPDSYAVVRVRPAPSADSYWAPPEACPERKGVIDSIGR
jgi:Trypsin-like peptidase domain/WD domain, G-beta repeat